MNSIDQQFIEYIVKSLVGHPDAVKVERRIDEKGVLLELTVDPEDLGRVIGKRGATAQSLRTLLRALGTKNDARYNLKIIDTGSPAPEKTADRRESESEKQPEPETAADKKDQPEAPAVADGGDLTEDDELPDRPSEDTSDVISRTRKELADLDDLDV
jgi:predicted RNA-binding protein YlqC (UPF0109 family)